MNGLLALVIHTANILGSFQDPFEKETKNDRPRSISLANPFVRFALTLFNLHLIFIYYS
jgi:hypothetical protein